MFQPQIVIYKRGKFVYYHWDVHQFVGPCLIPLDPFKNRRKINLCYQILQITVMNITLTLVLSKSYFFSSPSITRWLNIIFPIFISEIHILLTARFCAYSFQMVNLTWIQKIKQKYFFSSFNLGLNCFITLIKN